LIRLIEIVENGKIRYHDDVISNNEPSDTEIVSSIFVNLINYSIEFEINAPLNAVLNEFVSKRKLELIR